MAFVCSFSPVSREDAHILILGSMPGKVSLAQQQYYAHDRNLFWPLMAELLGVDLKLPYPMRLQRLQESGIALWDVLQQCERISALDADIVESSIVANDFAHFFARHPTIRRICFNGNKAEQAFRRYVLPKVTVASNMELVALPSTSPANASIPLAIKRQRWQNALNQDFNFDSRLKIRQLPD